MSDLKPFLPIESITKKILLIRGHKVILDKELAELYGVKPIALRQQARRNQKRFPQDFMFQLTKQEADFLVSQNVIPSKRSLGGFLPLAFTEQGVAMLSSVLTSDRAIDVNIFIMRAFVKLREIMGFHQELKTRIEQLEKQYDRQFLVIFEAINQLIGQEAEKEKKQIGFIKENH